MLSTIYLYDGIIRSAANTIGKGTKIGIRHFQKNAPHYKHAAGVTLKTAGKITQTGGNFIKKGTNLAGKELIKSGDKLTKK